MKILFIGDIFGKPGRKAVINELDNIKKTYAIDYVIANAENTTHGKSISPEHLKQLTEAGVNFFTMGNHTWGRKDITHTLNSNQHIIRPYNVAGSLNEGGKGTQVVKIKHVSVRITNLIGRTCFRFEKTPNPFLALDHIIETNTCPIHIVDFHAESTGEKTALALDFDGKVTAILGTHTHVQTADERILPKGTAFITDVGMTGARDGVIGAKPSIIINKQRTDSTFLLEVATGKYMLNAIILEIDEKTSKIKNLQRVNIHEK